MTNRADKYKLSPFINIASIMLADNEQTRLFCSNKIEHKAIKPHWRPPDFWPNISWPLWILPTTKTRMTVSNKIEIVQTKLTSYVYSFIHQDGIDHVGWANRIILLEQNQTQSHKRFLTKHFMALMNTSTCKKMHNFSKKDEKNQTYHLPDQSKPNVEVTLCN